MNPGMSFSPNKRLLSLASITLVLVLGGFSKINSSDPEMEAVLAAAQFYLDGHATGDPTIMSQAFHESARLQFLRNGEYSERSVQAYLGGMGGSPADNEGQRSRRVSSVDITGNSAVVKIELDYPGAFITDYMQMLKFGDEWKIVNKIFHVEMD